MIECMLKIGGSGEVIEVYGKVVVVGFDGEIEYVFGLIYILCFGNFYCEVVGVKFYFVFINICGFVNVLIVILFMDKNDVGWCFYYFMI